MIWTESFLNTLAADAIGQIAIDVNCIFARECMATVAGTSVYTLPAYVRTLRRVIWRGRGLDAVNWEELTLLSPVTVGGFIETSQSRPLYYAMHPSNLYDIRLYPTPVESFTTVGETNVYAPQANTPSCIIEYWREPDTTETVPAISLPPYIARRTKKAYIAWKAFSTEGKGQNLKAASYYQMKYNFLIEQFRMINEGTFVSKKYNIEDGMLGIDNFKYPKPFLNANFERVFFR